MKCTKCGKNDVNFFYTSNINGQVTEHNLCIDCAREMGLLRNAFAESVRMENRMFDNFFGKNMLESFFDGFGSFALGARDFLKLGDRKSCECGDACSCGEEKVQKKVEVDPAIAKRREINALRHKMKMAADAEDFETAAQIRDQIRGLEG